MIDTDSTEKLKSSSYNIDLANLKSIADAYYKLHPYRPDTSLRITQPFANGKIKLVIGTDYNRSYAKDCILALLDTLKANKTPIFLEFLQEKKWISILEEYNQDNLDPKLQRQKEEIMQQMLESEDETDEDESENESEDGSESKEENEDANMNIQLLDIIKAAKKAGVSIYPADTRFSNEECKYANYAIVDLVTRKSPDNFVLLCMYDNLLSKEGFPPLHRMIDAKAIAFDVDIKERKNLESECEDKCVFETYNNDVLKTILQKIFQENKENNETSILHAAKLKQQEKENSQIIFSIADCDLKTAGSWAQQITAITFILKQKKLPWHIDKNSKLNIPNSKYVIEHNQDPAKNITVQKTGNKITISAAAKQVASDVAMRYIILTQAIQKARSLQTRKIKIYGASNNLFSKLQSILKEMCEYENEFTLVDPKKHDCKVKI